MLGRSYCEWVGELTISGPSSNLVGTLRCLPASDGMGMGGGAVGSLYSRLTGSPAPALQPHRVEGSVRLGGGGGGGCGGGGGGGAPDELAYVIAGAWTGRVVATAPGGGLPVELLPAAPHPGRRVQLRELPSPLPYELPAHSLRWERHPQAVWGALVAALRCNDWAAASVENEARHT